MVKQQNRWLLGVSVGLLAFGCSSGGLFNSGGNETPANKVLTAKLDGSDGVAYAEVQFDKEDGHWEFEVEVSGGEPGATVNVTINGVVVVSLTLDVAGNAHVAFDSDPDEEGEDHLPWDFPGASEGDAVGVGDMSGSFHEEEEDDADDDDEADDDDDGDDDNGDDEADDADEDESEDGDDDADEVDSAGALPGEDS